MEIFIKQLQGITFAAKGNSNHWIMMDGPEEFAGSEAASRPMELMLMSLGGCTAADVASILQKKRVKLSGFEVKVTGERAKEHPQVFTKIHIEYIFYGENISQKDVERAIELSQTKYCSASAMLRQVAELTYSYRIESPVLVPQNEQRV
jgi:putative redox protein